MQEETGSRRREQIFAGVRRLTPFAVDGAKRLAPFAVKAVGARYPTIGAFGQYGLQILEERASNGGAGGTPDTLGQREMSETQPENNLTPDDDSRMRENDPPLPLGVGEVPMSTGALEASRALINDGPSGSGGSPHSAALPIEDRRASKVANSAQSGRSVTRATLSGDYDTGDVGGFSVSLYRSNHNVQLWVSQPEAPGHVRGLFTLERVPHSTWIHLEDHLSRLLPVWVLVEEMNVQVQVGAGPSNAVILRAADRKRS
jgi:hypothetical protein